MAEVESRETSDLISSEKVEGTAVMNRQGEKIGSIESVMIEKRSGKVAYAVMSFGGFLGIGNQHHPVPWNALTYDTNVGGYVIDADKARLQGAPTYAEQHPDWEDRAWGTRVYDHFGVPPYWM